MRKQKLFAVAAVIIMIVGVIVAYACEMNTSTIYDGNVGTVTASVGTHVSVIMIFVATSAVLLLLACKYSANSSTLGTNHYAFVGAYTISGLCFAFASGYGTREDTLQSYYQSMNSSPSWYSGDATGTSWFQKLPEVAEKFSSIATYFYILMFVGIVVTGIMAFRAFSKAKAA